MSVLVVGATGFIGPRVIRRLVARGEKVVGMDSNPGAATFAGVPDRRAGGPRGRHAVRGTPCAPCST
jgi:nucleoside-diphosphate-sugar epimerase